MLYDTKDIDHVVQMILEIIGKRFDVSRAYVFENADEDGYCDNTYEWCNEGITPQKENLQHLSYKEVEGYQDLFRDNAVFYCRDIHALAPAQTALFEKQGIHSTLQSAIMDNNRFHGFIGFDECTGMRMWTKEEISTLALISELLTVFLLKRRTSDRDCDLAVRLNTILDTQGAYVYTIERSSYELLYLNHMTRKLAPEAEKGAPCYSAFFNRTAPCENCPITGGSGEVYNPRHDIWFLAKAAPMKWDDLDAELLSCFDITQYKKMQEPGC